MNLIKVGDAFINLDQVRRVLWDNAEQKITVIFSPAQGSLLDSLKFEGPKAVALHKYLEENSVAVAE